MRFRTKPVVIEAIQFHAGKMTADEICKFVTYDCELSQGDGEEVFAMSIQTLEGELNVSDKDWIIKGVKGEFYPCKPDIFEATYESVQDQNENQRGTFEGGEMKSFEEELSRAADAFYRINPGEDSGDNFEAGARWAEERLREDMEVLRSQAISIAKIGLENANSDFCAHGSKALVCGWCEPFEDFLAKYEKPNAISAIEARVDGNLNVALLGRVRGLLESVAESDDGTGWIDSLNAALQTIDKILGER